MLYYLWLYTFVAPIAIVDMAVRSSPFYLGAWPLGFEHLAKDY